MIALALAASLVVPAVALALHQRLSIESPKDNLFLSPYGISSALAPGKILFLGRVVDPRG